MSEPPDDGASGHPDEYRHRLRMRFGAVADIYDRARPSYAPAAVAWVVGDRRRVLDLAAGTGKLSAAVLAAGVSASDIVAVDPSAPMLAVLRENLPGVDARVGSAEATGLEDASVDAIVVGSALHWFDRPAADEEMARVLRPDGVVGIFQNRRDASVPWVAALEELVGERTTMRRVQSSEDRRTPLASSWFGPVEVAEFPFTQQINADLLAELYASRSYVIDLGEDERADLLDTIRAFGRSHPDLAGRESFAMPYRSVARRQLRLSARG
jgi:ubiquinone/menaquinone biosynthesis C-methylase UbiE